MKDATALSRTQKHRSAGSASDLEGAWARPQDHGAPDWRKLLVKANEQIELCDYTLIDVIETPGATTLLANKAAAGATVKLLIASPDSVWLTLDEWPPSIRQQIAGDGPIIQGLRKAHQRLEALDHNTKTQARQALLPRCPVIFRFDEDMLVAIPIWGTRRPGAPLLHLKRRQQEGLFDRFANHYNALWETSHTIDPQAISQARYPANRTDDSRDASEPIRRPTLTPYGRRPPRRPR